MKILIKIYNWIIKMAKKVLNLDTVSGAKSWEDGGALPVGTVNQTLRHNGTEWVTTVNSLLTDGNADTRFDIVNNAVPANRYARIRVMTDTSQMILSRDSNKTITSYINDSESSIFMESDNGKYLRLYSHSYDKGITLRPTSSGDNQVLNIQSTQTYSATSKIFEFFGKFEIYQNGKIVSNYLSGSTNQLLEVTPNGTVQRYTGTIPSAQVNSDWNATSGVAEILNKPTIPTKIEHLSTSLIGTEYTVSRETLGITGDLRDRIKQMKVWIKNASGGDLRTDSTAGEYIGEDFISVEFNTDLSGNYVKIILYID